VDFTDPMLPPGMTAEKIHGSIDVALKQMSERGWSGELRLIQPDETAEPEVERRLTAQAFDCGDRSRHSPVIALNTRRRQRRHCRSLATGQLNGKAIASRAPLGATFPREASK
jgi:hypothetical protein